MHLSVYKCLSWLFFTGTILCTSPQVLGDQIAYWSLDGATVNERLEETLKQTAIDASESGGASSWTTRTGFGNVLSNGSTGKFLTVPHVALLDPGEADFSISLWVNRTSDANEVKGILDFLSSSAGSGYQVFYQNNNTIRVRIDDTNGNTKIIDTIASHYTINTWQNIIVTVDRTADKAKIFINGSEATLTGGVDISNLTGSIIPDQDLEIATFNSGTAARGQFDDLGLFNAVLTPAQIAAINANGGTPLSQINFTTTAPLAAVTLSPSSGVLRTGETVTISHVDTVDAIYYTLDGSDPDTNSPVYSTPLSLSIGGQLKAVAYLNNVASEITEKYFAVIPATAPNIVLVIANDLGFGDLSCNGSPTIYTPNLDRLAREGTRYTQWTNTGPGDLANQYATLTGRVARRGGLPDSINPADAIGLDAREWTLADALRKSGYDTAMIGTWHLGDKAGSKPQEQGFQLFYGLPYRQDALPAPPLMEGATTVEDAHNPVTLLAQLTARAKVFINAHDAPNNEPFFLLFQPPSLPSTGVSLQGSYGNQVEALDAAIGELRAAIQASGNTTNTLIIFLSDEGPDVSLTDSLGSVGIFKDGKSTTWEGGVRVPAMASWPGVIPVASDNYAPIWTPDLFTSLVEIADAYSPQDRPYDGTNASETLLSVRTHPDEEKRIFLHRYNGSAYQLQVVRKGEWKYHISYQNSDPQNTFSTPAPLLFQVEEDPTEHINRSSSHTAILSELQQAATNYEATFDPSVLQLPIAKPPFIKEPKLNIEMLPLGEGKYSGNFIRPRDSLNDQYRIELSADLSTWTRKTISPYITSITTQPNDNESVEILYPLSVADMSHAHYFLRITSIRP